MMLYTTYEVVNRIGYITLNRPGKRNALNDEFVAELRSVFAQAENDPSAKVLVLRSSAEVFCAGADLSYLQQMQSYTYEENLDDSRNLMLLFRQLYRCGKLLIAQVEGHAIAGGAGLATVCDFIFSVPEASFGYTEVKIGFVPAIVSVFLSRKLGESKARELLLTGKLISAQAAQTMGLVYQLSGSHTIKEEVYDFAQKIIHETSGQSITLTKKLLADIQHLSFDAAMDHTAEVNAIARGTEDCKTGISAFLNKEKISW